MSTSASEALLATLVRFDTTSRCSNLPLVGFVRDYLASYGVESRPIASACGTKANLFATIGPTDRGGFLLAGHTDVVPVDGQAWTSDPFALERRGPRLLGRGTADMKGFIASVLAAVPRLATLPLRTPVHLALSYDEEVGCVGVRDLLEMLNRFAIKPVKGLVGEPTSMRVAIGHKGKLSVRIRVRGRACHSSTPDAGVNAVMYAARIIGFIGTLHDGQRRGGPFEPGYDVPYTTLHVGTVSGGSSLNSVPAECTIEFEIRHVPGAAPEPLLERIREFVAEWIEPAMRRVAPEAGVTIEPLVSYPGLSTAPDAEIVRHVASLLDAEDTPERLAFGTEAGLFHQRAGIPMVLCGPGSMADAHRADESLACTELAACDAFVERLGASLCA